MVLRGCRLAEEWSWSVPCFDGGSQNKSAPLKTKRIVLRIDMRIPFHDFSAYGNADFFVYGVWRRMQY
jgi:hypothetical protein